MKLTETNLVRYWISTVLLGDTPGFKINGTKKQLGLLSSALMATKVFEQEMQKPEATVESIMEALDRKHRLVLRFEKVFGKNSWPL